MTRPSAKCPACGSTTLLIIESSEAFTDFEQVEGVIDPIGYNHHGDIMGLLCRCRACRHTWTPKRAHQITDLAGYPRPVPAPAPEREP